MCPRAGSQSGSVAIEFALVLPVLLMLVAGTLDWGIALSHQVSLIDVTRDAAFAGARATSAEGPETVARARALSGLDTAGLDASAATVTTSRVTLSSGSALRVHITFPSDPAFALLGMPDTFGGTTVALLEHP